VAQQMHPLWTFLVMMLLCAVSVADRGCPRGSMQYAKLAAHLDGPFDGGTHDGPGQEAQNLGGSCRRPPLETSLRAAVVSLAWCLCAIR
jgi:hypothetical protein